MSLKECRLEKGMKQREVVAVLRASGSKVDKALYSHAESERIDLNAKDRETVAKLFEVDSTRVATSLPCMKTKSKEKRNPELRARVSRQTLAKIDKAIKKAGFVDRRDWLMFCIRKLIGGGADVH